MTRSLAVNKCEKKSAEYEPWNLDSVRKEAADLPAPGWKGPKKYLRQEAPLRGLQAYHGDVPAGGPKCFHPKAEFFAIMALPEMNPRFDQYYSFGRHFGPRKIHSA
jgi:hypothetical protein